MSETLRLFEGAYVKLRDGSINGPLLKRGDASKGEYVWMVHVSTGARSWDERGYHYHFGPQTSLDIVDVVNAPVDITSRINAIEEKVEKLSVLAATTRVVIGEIPSLDESKAEDLTGIVNFHVGGIFGGNGKSPPQILSTEYKIPKSVLERLSAMRKSPDESVQKESVFKIVEGGPSDLLPKEDLLSVGDIRQAKDAIFDKWKDAGNTSTHDELLVDALNEILQTKRIFSKIRIRDSVSRIRIQHLLESNNRFEQRYRDEKKRAALANQRADGAERNAIQLAESRARTHGVTPEELELLADIRADKVETITTEGMNMMLVENSKLREQLANLKRAINSNYGKLSDESWPINPAFEKVEGGLTDNLFVGAFVLLRNGNIVGPIFRSPHSKWHWAVHTESMWNGTWAKDGSYQKPSSPSEYDIVGLAKAPK